MNLAYMQILGYELLERYDKREQTIEEWMERDRVRDQRISNTELKHEPPCQHCGQLKLDCSYKTLMKRDQNEDLVLLLFRCNNCHKNSAYWEDDAPYQISHDDASKDVEEVEEASPPKKRSYKNHDIKDVTDPYYWDIDPEHDPDVKESIKEVLNKSRDRANQLERMLNEVGETADLEREKFTRFALGFIDGLGIHFVTLSPINVEKCKQILFPDGFWMTPEKNVYTHQISPIYRYRNKKFSANSAENPLWCEWRESNSHLKFGKLAY